MLAEFYSEADSYLVVQQLCQIKDAFAFKCFEEE